MPAGLWGWPLEPFYPVLFFDVLRINVQEGSKEIKKSVYLALAIQKDGKKELLGAWIEQSNDAKFCMNIMDELRNRGLQDALIAVVGGLPGFPEAITAVFPKTEVQQCIIHLVRNSVNIISNKDRMALTGDLKKIYLAPNAKAAASALEDFSKTWDAQYPLISKSWQNRWTEVIPFLKFKPEIRKAIYTTNAIGSVNSAFQRVVKNKQAFTNDEEAMKFLATALQDIAKRWTKPIRDWRAALNQFAGIYGDRVPYDAAADTK
jgi:transposase-like protein